MGMGGWIYNNEVVRGHSIYPVCHSTLNAVSRRDYGNTYSFRPDIECLDMDTYEKNVLRKGQPDCTVDAVIGISTYENNRVSSPRLLLVELRMDYDNIKNLSKTAMENKVIYTKKLLGRKVAIELKSIFLFKEKLASQAKSWFNRQSRTGGELNNCRACSVSEFHNIIKSPSDFPYTPIHSEENIRTDLKKHENTADWKLFLGQIKYWREIAEKYRYSNKSEFEHISNVIKTIWEEFKKKNYSFSDDELLEIWCEEEKINLL